MGQRQNFLKQTIDEKFKLFKNDRLTNSDLESSDYLEAVTLIYRKLGGQYNPIPLNYGSWDITTHGFIIELDEERHFNRYRLLTLTSDIYSNYSLFSPDNYKKYCLDNEAKCLSAAKWSKNWKTDSSERMFLKSNTEGDLYGNGSSRWRQRAYYDFLKDVTSLVKDVPVIRVSIYDKFKNKTIDDILALEDKKMLTEFITSIKSQFI